MNNRYLKDFGLSEHEWAPNFSRNRAFGTLNYYLRQRYVEKDESKQLKHETFRQMSMPALDARPYMRSGGGGFSNVRLIG